MTRVRPVAIDYEGQPPNAKIIPSNNEGQGNWFENWLHKEGCQGYLLIDLRIKEGRRKLINCNDFREAWEKKVSVHSAQTIGCCKIYDIMHILTKNKTKHGVYTSSIEMMHQLISIIQVMTASCINHFTAQLSNDALRVGNFLSAGMCM